MKKLVLFLFFTIINFPAVAEELHFTLLTKQNVETELGSLFKQADTGKVQVKKKKIIKRLNQRLQNSETSASKSTSLSPLNSNKPWQFLLFLADRDRPLKETLATLRQRIQKGELMQAVVLVTPRAYNRDSLQQAELYFIYNDGEKPITKKFCTENMETIGELLDLLFSHLKESSDDFYTGMLIDAHGNGETMTYKLNNEISGFSITDILEPLKEKGIKLDLLVLDSCRMSSLLTLYYLTKTNVADFLVASSDMMYSSLNTMYFHILRFLNYSPRQAAILSVNYRLRFLNFDRSWFTNNASVLELQQIREPFQNWLKAYNDLLNYMPQVQDAVKTWFPQKDTYRSLSRTIERYKEYLQNYSYKMEESSNPFVDEVRSEFIRTSDEFLDALRNGTLREWCYSNQENHLYQENGNVPTYHNDCMASVNVSQYQLETKRDIYENDLASEIYIPK